MNLKKMSVYCAAALLCLLCLLSVPSFSVLAAEQGPAFRDGQQIQFKSEGLQTASETKTEADVKQAVESAADPESAAKTDNRGFGTVETEESTQYEKGELLGSFQIVGYYGDGITYSGVKPQANHTVSADRTVLPIGTKILIGKTVYTVEDIGSGVKGKMIDIFFDTREEAVNVTRDGAVHADVYLAVPKENK